jgi:hypothetical protein
MLTPVVSMLTNLGQRNHEVREDSSPYGSFDNDNDNDNDNERYGLTVPTGTAKPVRGVRCLHRQASVRVARAAPLRAAVTSSYSTISAFSMTTSSTGTS